MRSPAAYPELQTSLTAELVPLFCMIGMLILEVGQC